MFNKIKNFFNRSKKAIDNNIQTRLDTEIGNLWDYAG